MTQLATISRYCAIEDKVCEKILPYEGSWTYFFAYPGNEDWRDFSLHLSEELRDRGFYGQRREDTISNDLLFSKVCEGIHSHDFLLAEVTDPNQNVMLENGYALAVGRQPILLKNNNRKEWARRLLTTLEGCPYSTREDIFDYIAKLQSSERRDDENPDRRLRFLENMGIFQDSETAGTVYHLKPQLSADWISTVDRELKGSYFKLTTMDPSDSVSDEFFPQAREIQRASRVVASLVSSTNRNWEQHNSNVAILIGFAIGLGKRVLVLQESPAPAFLDLGTVSRTVRNESEARNIVKAWIAVETELSVSQKTDSQRRTRDREQIEHIRKVYLGHPDALQDNRLLDYYVETKEFDDAIQGRRTLFIGRRGSGKSANFQAIKSHLSGRNNTLVVPIAPDDFELESISEFLAASYSLVSQKVVFRNTWNYILLSEIMKSLAERTDKLYQSPDDLVQINLYDYYETNQHLLNLDFGTRVTRVLEAAASTKLTVLTDDALASEQGDLGSLRNYQIARRLKEFATREGITYHVIADDLDKHWRPDSEQSIDLLIGLIAEADRLQRFFSGHLQVAMFLREDIYDVLVHFDNDLPQRNLIRMEWTKANLKHLVAERLARTADQDNNEDDSTWSVVFPDKIGNVSASDYILSRSLPRPRDVLDFCQKSIDQAQRNGHTAVTEQDILDGESSFSESVFWSVSTEFRGIYPNLEDILIEYAGVPERMNWDEFAQVSEKAITRTHALTARWIQAGNLTPIALAEILFKVGVIGFSATNTIPYFANGRSFAETWSLVGPSPIVFIHPAFTKSLDIASVRIQSPTLRRRARIADSNQLHLEFPPPEAAPPYSPPPPTV